MDWVHFLGKSERRRVVEVLVGCVGRRQATELLGVSGASISKYLDGAMHLSDERLREALGALEGLALERPRTCGSEVVELAADLATVFSVLARHVAEWSEALRGRVERRLNRGVNLHGDVLEEAAAFPLTGELTAGVDG